MMPSSEIVSEASPQPPYPLHPSVSGRIDPEYAGFYDRHIKNQQQVHLQPIEKSRASGTLIPGAGEPRPVASSRDLFVERATTSGPKIPIRIFTPQGDAPEGGWPLCFWFHGGGWVLGNIDTENVIATHLCDRGRCVVICVDYRLAPENPFPAAVDDCWESFLWAVDRSAGELSHVNRDVIAVGGSSAGGNLTAVICQRVAGMNMGTRKVRVQLLSVPVMDNTASVENNVSWRENEFTPALPAPKMMWYREHYLPNAADRPHPEASPMFWDGDWSRLPPAVILVGELDVLRHEGQQFGEKLSAAGVQAETHVMKGQPHPFIAMDGVLEAGRSAITIFCEALLKATAR